MSQAVDYIALTKPRILPLIVLSGLPALVLASGGWPSFSIIVTTLMGTCLAAGSANSLNSYLERDLDAKMERTRGRPMPSGRLQPGRALAFAVGLGVAGVAILGFWLNLAAAGIALAAIGIYVFGYTLWLKPRTPFALMVGGISGAIAPLIADCAVNGRIGAAGWILFAIVFAWQPPHFYAIALFNRDDYSRAGFPMLPDRIGEAATRDRIVAWSVVLLLATFLPVVFLSVSWLYGIAALALGMMLLVRGWELQARPSRETARSFMMASLIHLMGVFTAMICDLAFIAR
ncbi:MAG: protoheme IX farnesyltransferase [bacterium]|nr:protoheme IX farnesyltransferase [bacterium]MCP5066802.1 protoheme IX farnesyltransferase [bacterium]